MLMDGVMSAAPPERAASSASLAQLANELGIALGLTVLGSLGTVVYRMPPRPPRLPPLRAA